MAPRRRRRPAVPGWVSCGVGLLGALPATTASAEVAPVVIAYRPSVACPGEAAFLEAVRGQTPNSKPPPAGAPARRLSIDIVRNEGRVLGTLRVEEIDGATSVRQVAGPTCDAVASALVLVTALTIDGGPRSLGPLRAAARARPTLPADPTRAPDVAPASRARVVIGGLAGAYGGLAPGLAGGVELFSDWRPGEAWGSAPSLRFAIAFAASPATATPGGTVSFLWLAARLSACPLAITLGPLTAQPCAGIDAGMLHARGTHVARPEASARPWVAPTLAARTQWAIAPTMSLEVDVGLAAPLLRDRFVFDTPPADAHAVPPVSGSVCVGIGFLLGTPSPPRFP